MKICHFSVIFASWTISLIWKSLITLTTILRLCHLLSTYRLGLMPTNNLPNSLISLTGVSVNQVWLDGRTTCLHLKWIYTVCGMEGWYDVRKLKTEVGDMIMIKYQKKLERCLQWMLSLACGQSPAPSQPHLCPACPVSGPQRVIILYYSDPPTLSPQTTQFSFPSLPQLNLTRLIR